MNALAEYQINGMNVIKAFPAFGILHDSPPTEDNTTGGEIPPYGC